MNIPVSDLEKVASTARQVAAEAAELVQRMRGEARLLDSKSSATDLVTEADQAAERLVRERLEQLRPGERVLGEELGGDTGTDGVSWVVDPIDGTVNFVHGYPHFAVSLGYQVDGVSVAGAIVEPLTGREWWAASGLGSWCDGAPLRVSAAEKLDLSLVATGFGYTAKRRAQQAAVVTGLLSRVADIRRSGSAAVDLCSVAAGWVDAYAEHGVNRWDYAAGEIIAREAGAVTRFPDHPEDDGLGPYLTVVAAPGIADALFDALREVGAGQVTEA
ncbi:inositol monophosphatase [Pseudonocardiaceae bacterium YIM PH 21723]|nr:inositol monophosphatase [Pseudonocardiaceae bacterium YIM PH 21723]